MRLQDHIWETTKIVTCIPVSDKVVSYGDSKLIKVVNEEDFNGETDGYIVCEKGRFFIFPETYVNPALFECLWKNRYSYYMLHENVVVFGSSKKGIEKVLERMQVDSNVLAKARSIHL